MTECETGCELCGRELHGDARAYLCPGCTAVTTERLAAMPGLYAALAGHLQPGRTADGPVSVKAVEPPLPVSEPVLSLRAFGGMVTILEGWRSALHEALGWSQPVPAGTIEDRVKKAAGGLHINMLWIAASWSAAGVMAEEIRDLHRDVTSITAPPDDRGLRMGNCPAAYEGVLCGAVLRLPPGGAVATCKWCGATYPPATWARLRLAQEAAISPAASPAASEGRLSRA